MGCVSYLYVNVVYQRQRKLALRVIFICLDDCAIEVVDYDQIFLTVKKGGEGDEWEWAYLLSELCDRAGTVRTRARLAGSSNPECCRHGLECSGDWRVWRAQVKPGGKECDSANKLAPRRRKRPGFSLPSSFYLAFQSTFQKKALRDIRPTSRRRSTCTGLSGRLKVLS